MLFAVSALQPGAYGPLALVLLLVLLILLVLLLILLVHGSTPLSIEKYAVSIRPAPPFYAAVTA